ncbi:MarR family transcriptional regulator [Streptomyces sp. ISL-66]|uniref:MarR family winged helix-turn-helix transcriptional regulator n=1 Tax=Streptomyces sp. ISL-66 TaxID=2819186 RepID=UPI001BEAE2D4|nr:MarR family transcriptional regulator [Streptomyces sp. ISL-66]MBT2471821.1 MarR family transcriptional regulator [Streptomyces sp. ISL-66]
MGVKPTASRREPHDAAEAAREVVELLEILWERGREAASPGPVSPSQLRVMYILDRDEGINLRTLGEVMGATSSSVSRLCDRLQALGYVRRTPSPVSRRELELKLTSRGRSHLYELRALREESLLAVISAMPPAARHALVEGLEGFRETVGESDLLHPQTRDVTQSA